MSFDNIPAELRALSQWVCWQLKPDEKGKLQKVPLRPVDGYGASTTNPRDWTSFQYAVQMAQQHQLDGIGFVFTQSDPYCGIDLDDPGIDTDKAKQHNQTLNSLNSYSEWSPSGKGVHIIVQAKLPDDVGTHPKTVGIFNSGRYFTFTGNLTTAVAIPIAHRQLEIEQLYALVAPPKLNGQSNGVDHNETHSDADVICMASSAGNGSKFNRLWSGDWQTDYGHKSQSEADFALVNMIAFHSRNHSQTVRLFRQSGLGQRAKAKTGKYVAKMATDAFDRFNASIEMPTVGSPWFDANTVAPWIGPPAPARPVEPTPWTVPTVANAGLGSSLAGETASGGPVGRPGKRNRPEPPPLMVIPGMVGALAVQAWNASPYRFPEMCIASALSTMSLLCSRSYRHGTLGLSIFVLLLAETSVGKSFAFSANDAWYSKLMKEYRDMSGQAKKSGDERLEYLRGMIVGNVGSAEGLATHILKHPSTLVHADEWVDTIKAMAQTNVPPGFQRLKDELLQLVELSGPTRVYRPRIYSERSGPMQGKEVIAASLSILATGVPDRFFAGLNVDLLISGFLPRFTILHYSGGLTRENKKPLMDIEPTLYAAIKALFDISYNKSLLITGELTDFVNVEPNMEDEKDWPAIEAFDNFNDHCDNMIDDCRELKNNMGGMWARAKARVRQISSLIAIGCNPYAPKIIVDHIATAIRIIQPGIDDMQSKLLSGEISSGDDKLEYELRKQVYRMRDGGSFMFAKYPNIKPHLIDNGKYQIAILRMYCMQLSCFKNQRISSGELFDKTLRTMIFKLGEFAEYTELTSGIKCVVIVRKQGEG